MILNSSSNTLLHISLTLPFLNSFYNFHVSVSQSCCDSPVLLLPNKSNFTSIQMGSSHRTKQHQTYSLMIFLTVLSALITSPDYFQPLYFPCQTIVLTHGMSIVFPKL